MIIGFAGKAGSGKDTAADYLVAQGFTKISFASPLKAGLAAMGFPEPVNRDDKEKQIEGFDFSWREAAQKLGTEWGRGLDPNMWIKIASLNLQANPTTDFVFADLRFENEALTIREAGGYIMHLHGMLANLGSNFNHASEQSLTIIPGKDFVIENVKNPLLTNSQNLNRLYKEIDKRMAVIDSVKPKQFITNKESKNENRNNKTI